MIEERSTVALGRSVYLRGEGSDRQVWVDTFEGRYHMPPQGMNPPDSVLDLGANIGLTAAHYKVCWPDARVVAVEMAADCCELIRRNAPDVEVRCHAVSGAGGWGAYDPAALPWARTFQSSAGKVVFSYTLREVILRMFGDGGVDFVKMDIEGEEWAVFDAATWAPHVRHLLVELHPVGDMSADPATLVRLAAGKLAAAGFSVDAGQMRHPSSVWAWR